MYEIIASNRFSKHYKQCKKRKYEIELLNKLLRSLAENGKVPNEHYPHMLSGNYRGCWECHIKTDWLLIWIKNELTKSITLVATGTHSDLF